MAKSKRVTLTQAEAASAYGQRLVHQILAISDDGDLSIEEVRALHVVLMDGNMEMESVPFLRAMTTTILHDGQLDHLEMYQLRRAMERVVPKAVRSDLSILLSRIGLPTVNEDEDDKEPGYRVSQSWHDDPVTTRQLEYIRDLGGVATERMTKGAASLLIDQLLERRPPTPRQRMVLRFFDRLDLECKTKEEIGVWLNSLYAEREDYERAWQLFKADVGDDGSFRDPSAVPIGAFRKYLRSRRTQVGNSNRYPIGWLVAMLLFLATALLLFLLFR